MVDMTIENEYRPTHAIIAGLDEAGRGSFAGPLVAAAVILPENAQLPGIGDSKKISKNRHLQYSRMIVKEAIAIGVGVASVEYIDKFGVGEANKYALKKASENLHVTPDLLLIDGDSQQVIITPIAQRQVIKGDAKSLSIASASIIAKTIHDILMTEYADEYPHYGWESNTGYGAPQHFEGMKKHGITPYHRRSVKPVQKIILENEKKPWNR